MCHLLTFESFGFQGGIDVFKLVFKVGFGDFFSADALSKSERSHYILMLLIVLRELMLKLLDLSDLLRRDLSKDLPQVLRLASAAGLLLRLFVLTALKLFHGDFLALVLVAFGDGREKHWWAIEELK